MTHVTYKAVQNLSLRTVEKPQIEDTAFHSISGHTLSVLLDTLTQEEFDEKFILIDCRYPFEYNGGHVKVIYPAFIRHYQSN